MAEPGCRSSDDRPVLEVGAVSVHLPRTGWVSERRHDAHPVALAAWCEGPLPLAREGTHFGFVGAGTARLKTLTGEFTLQPHMYFCAPQGGVIEGTGFGFVATHWKHRGFFLVGGPIEPSGRLRYINGCTDSLLIPPIVLGDPCLNLLHVPPHTHQSDHTHPTIRYGMIVQGDGLCRTPQADHPLHAGSMFVILPDAEHSFHTRDRGLLIVAWHPDTDTGPTHEQHPMLNRTILSR